MNTDCEAEVRGIGVVPAEAVPEGISRMSQHGMQRAGFSLVEVMMAAVIIVIGLTAAAVLAGTIMAQQELNAAALRAANVQEQAVKLYRMDLSSSAIRGILPESCISSGTPPTGGYTLSFSVASATNVAVGGATVNLDSTVCTLLHGDPASPGTYGTHTVTIIRPSTRVRYAQ